MAHRRKEESHKGNLADGIQDSGSIDENPSPEAPNVEGHEGEGNLP